MNRCLSDRALWLMSEGEASPPARAHIAACAACTARLRRLEKDLHYLTAALQEPPGPSAALPPSSSRLTWLRATAALAAMLLVAWIGLWQRPLISPLPVESSQESTWLFIDGVAAALFASVDSGAFGTSEPLTDMDDLQAALVGDWPCDEQLSFVDMACADDTVALLLGGQ